MYAIFLFPELHACIMKLWDKGKGGKENLWGLYGGFFQMKIDFDKSIGKEKIRVEFIEWTEEHHVRGFKETILYSGFFILEGLMMSNIFLDSPISGYSSDSIGDLMKILDVYHIGNRLLLEEPTLFQILTAKTMPEIFY
jgi:hypothetical protein